MSARYVDFDKHPHWDADKDKKMLTDFLLKMKDLGVGVIENGLAMPGMLKENEFDQSLLDLMAFLTHAGEPQKDDREKLGVWVLMFMGLLILLTYLIYRSYWEPIKK